MKLSPRPLVFLTLLCCTIPSAAEELDASLKVSDLTISVQVRHKDGRPAQGVRLRLLYGRQLALVTSRTDAEGHWTYTAERSGAYELLVETGPRAEDVIRLPFAAVAAEQKTGPRLVPGALGLLCVFFALFLGIRGRLALRPALVTIVLLAGGGSFLAWSVWPREQRSAEDTDLEAAARDFLRIEDVKPLSGPLEKLLNSPPEQRVKSMPHDLLGTAAPQFELRNHRGETYRLHERLERGPVVVVFYYGYHCNHCVSQLFALHDDIAKFRELGAEVVAISADPPEVTRERFRKYGEFAYPVLTDPGNKIARDYAVYQPALGDMPEDLKHGTFVIGRDGRVHWAHHGYEPFTGNLTLLHELARLEKRLPPTTRP